MSRTVKKAYLHIAAAAALFAMLAATTYALLTSYAEVRDNLFDTGTVEISLGEKPVFDDVRGLAPGGGEVRPLTLENTGTAEVFYRLYLENVSGPGADALYFEIYDSAELLYTVRASAFMEENAFTEDRVLRAGEIRSLQIRAVLPEWAGNSQQSAAVTFDLVAKAVQSRNNEQREFPQ